MMVRMRRRTLEYYLKPAEDAIEPSKCQKILLDHIQNQQQAVISYTIEYN